MYPSVLLIHLNSAVRDPSSHPKQYLAFTVQMWLLETDRQTDSTFLVLRMWHFLVIWFIPAERGGAAEPHPFLSPPTSRCVLESSLWNLLTFFTQTHIQISTDLYRKAHTCLLACMHTYTHKRKSAHIHKYSIIHKYKSAPYNKLVSCS